MEVTREKLAFLIIALVVLMLFLNLLANYFIDMREKVDRQMCKNSVKANAGLKVDDFDMSEPIRCPAMVNKIDSDDDKEIMHEIATDMYHCWDMYGRGELELFQIELDKEITFCTLCYMITFEEKGKQIPMKDFITYLNTKKSLTGETYLEFLKGYGTENSPIDFESLTRSEMQNNTKHVIDTADDYGVYFIYRKSPYTSKKLNMIRGAGVGFTIGSGVSVIPGVGAVTGIAAIAGGTLIGGSYGYMTGDDGKDWSAYTMIYPHNEDTLSRMNCDILPVLGEKGR